MSNSEPKALEVYEDDCVLILGADGVRLYTPTTEGGEDMQAHMLMALAIAHLSIHDYEWVFSTLERYNNSLETMKREMN